MQIIVENITTPSQNIKSFVRDLVQSNSANISMFVYDNNSLLRPYLAQREVTRAHMLLSRVGLNNHEKTYLLLAKNKEDSTPLGFALISPFIEYPNRGSMTMTAVAEPYRKLGVFREIMSMAKSICNQNLTLTCKPAMVDFYKKFDLVPCGTYQTHIKMSTDTSRNDGTIISVDDEFVMKNHKVLQEYRNLEQRHGANTLKIAIKNWQEDFATGEKYSEDYWENIKKSL